MSITRVPSLRTVVLAVGLSTPVMTQVEWTLHAPATSPSARFGHAMAFDPARERIVMFGGVNGPAAPTGTWEWDGATWSQRATTGPLGQLSHAMVHDVAAGGVLLFGAGGRTRRWDGASWSTPNVGSEPPLRFGLAMAADPVRQRVVMFGGDDYQVRLADTWEWDGQRWTQRNPTRVPAPRSFHQMAFDATRGRVELTSGFDGQTVFDDTWEWDGQNWTRISQNGANGAGGPVGGLVFDTARGRLLRYAPGNTREWTGTGWVARTTTAEPATLEFSIAYDAVREETVVFGGQGGGTSPADRTWIYAAVDRASLLPFGTACTGSNGTPRLAPRDVPGNLPWLGTTLQLEIDNVPAASALVAVLVGFSNQSWGNLQLPLDLTPLGMPSCFLSVRPEFAFTATPPVAGTSSWSLPVPNIGALRTLAFYLQGVVTDAPANAAGFTTSNGLAGRIGAR